MHARRQLRYGASQEDNFLVEKPNLHTGPKTNFFANLESHFIRVVKNGKIIDLLILEKAFQCIINVVCKHMTRVCISPLLLHYHLHSAFTCVSSYMERKPVEKNFKTF